jgi:hypothetical protein
MEIVSGGEALREALSFLAWRGRVLGKYWEILGNADAADTRVCGGVGLASFAL